MSIYDFKHGIRIPAGSCAAYSNTPKAQMISQSGGLSVFNFDGPIDVECVCQLPLPEKALVRQFVMVGNVEKGQIQAELGGVRWNVPRQHILYSSLNIMPTTPYEVLEMKQKKAVANLPVSGPSSLVTDRIQSYFIQARFTSNQAVSLEQALEIFYFEIYWD
jgi:hypothetical protein